MQDMTGRSSTLLEVPEWLTVDEAMKYLRVSRSTLYRWCDEGRLRFYELESGGGRRFNREDLDKMLRPGEPTLRELQRRMAAPDVYNSGAEEFQAVAHMVRDAVTGSALWPATVDLWLGKAEATNPPESEHGRLVRLAGPLLRAYAKAASEPQDCLPQKEEP